MGQLIYILVMVVMAMALPSIYFDPDARQFIFIIGVVAVWRYSWAIQHFFRALIYLKVVFPRMRKKADALGTEGDPIHAFFLVTTFRIDTDTSVDVYRETVKEAIRCGVPSTVIASIVEMSEERLVKQIFQSLNPPENVDLKLVRIPGTGKRDALAAGFRAVSSTPVHLEDSVVSVIDGDTILSPGCASACFRMFKINPRLGAVTTDEECTLIGEGRVTGIYRRWYNLRFAQRNVYMASMALSRHVLTLTGRMSMFRGNIVGDPEFISRVEFDAIDHWRLGRFRFLTGDDKSTWYHVLKDGWDMGYVPDALILTVEEPPNKEFFTGANVLMRRWFGNMLRTNARARMIPRKTTGTYTWWALRDQMLSMWTSLFGFTAAILGSLKFGPELLLAFTLWILFTRYIMAKALAVFHKQFSISWPFLVYFNQIYGSLVKIFMLHHLYKQTWTRQKTSLKSRKGYWQQRYMDFESRLAWGTSMLLFLVLMSFFVGLYELKDLQALF
ncbi:glycosyltransferase [Candidatus Reidiella endopervernicosa]|nr:glycosyltransferase [Candidatus Reidiella endopervernicosa]QKQ27098.1 glycosyltransferase [Candidatus Reidiella endopervernicosa]